jgi:hypothetical protein
MTFQRPKTASSLIALFSLPVETEADGLCHLFFAVDAFDGYAFNLGAEQNNSMIELLDALDVLINDPHFDPHPQAGFTLVLADYEAHAEKLEDALAIFNGKVQVDVPLNAHIAKPLLDSLQEALG